MNMLWNQRMRYPIYFATQRKWEQN